MNKVKCEVCSGFGLDRDMIGLYDEQCTSCNGKGFFDNPDDAGDHSIESATLSLPNWRNVSREIVKFQTIRIKDNF